VSASVPATARRRQRRRRSPAAALARWSIVGGLTCFALSALFPLAFMAVTAFRSEKDWDASKLGLPTTFSFGSFERAWSGATISTYFRNSAIVTLGTVLLTVICATLAGYSFSKLRWRGSGAVYFFVLAWIAIPPLLLIVPVYVEIVNLGLLDTYWSVILLYTALNLPFNVYLMAAFFRSLPDELLEAARIDGAGLHRSFLQIMVPLARPAIATLCIFNFLWAWNEFLYALLLLTNDDVKTLTVGVLQLQGRFTTDYPALMAGLLITSLPVVGVYLLFQRHLVRAIVAGAVK
jgi:ABC-type glycerol-3-phosphate transport system permease component